MSAPYCLTSVQKVVLPKCPKESVLADISSVVASGAWAPAGRRPGAHPPAAESLLAQI